MNASKSNDFPEPTGQQLIGMLPIGIVLCDRAGRVVRHNERASEMLRRSLAQGEPFCDAIRFLGSEGIPLADSDCPVSVALRSGASAFADGVITGPENSPVTVRVTATPSRDPSGSVNGVVVSLQDGPAPGQGEAHQATLAAIVDSSDDAIVSKTLKGVITSWNAAAERIFGYTAAEATGRHISLIIPTDRLEEENIVLARLSRGEKIDHFETVRRTKDGRLIDISLTVSPVRGKNGTIIGASKVARDVTERNLSQRALGLIQVRYRKLFDSAGVSLWEEDFSSVKRAIADVLRSGVTDFREYLRKNPEFVDRSIGMVRVVDVNLASVHLFEARDKSELLTGLNQVFEPSTRDFFAEELIAIAEQKTQFEGEVRLRTLTGRRLDVVVSIRFPQQSVPLEAETGFESVLVSLTDITERRRAEDMAHTESEIRKTLLNVGASLARELDPERLMQAATDAATQLTSAEFGAFVAGDETLSTAGVRRDAFDVVKQIAPSCLTVPVAGSSREIFGRLVFCHSANQAFTPQHEQLAIGVASWTAVALDNARLYKSAQDANATKDEFLATLSHELRTPLNAMLGWTHLLRSGTLAGEMRQRALDALERNGRAQAQLVDDLLDVSRIVSGRLQLQADEVELGGILSSAIETMRPAATAKQLTVRMFIPSSHVTVSGDPDRLRQVFWNLLSNAVKFTTSGGTIDVALKTEGDAAEVEIRDTGIGIPRDFLTHVFERFRQADSSHSRRHGGLGLGLAIVRHLVEAHGGTVGVDSPGEGRGSTFTVRLPIRAVRKAVRSPVAGETRQQMKLTDVHVLVVDDERDAREFLAALLTMHGAVVDVAASAGEALGIISSRRVDILLGDLGLPGRDGYALIEAIRSLGPKRGGSIPAVAVTAYAGLRERTRAFEAGYGWHVAKPIDPDQLIDVVITALASPPPQGAEAPGLAGA